MEASHPEWVIQGAKFSTIDYSDQPTLVAAFEGVDVVISTINGAFDGIQGQIALADAAKAAGVKIFAPSEYGSPSITLGGGVGFKKKVHDHLQEIGLPYAIFYTGAFPDMMFRP